jgi:HEAT repeat protein
MPTLFLLALLAAPPLDGVPASHASVLGLEAGLPPAAWAPADTADALYREARRALNGGDLNRAAALFNQIHSRHPRSAYAPDAFYWEAFARHRLGDEANLRRGLALLQTQARRHPTARTRSDAATLETRIRGSLAEGGDRDSSVRLARAVGGAQTGCADAELRAAALVALFRSEPAQATALAREVLQRRDTCSVVLREHAAHLLGQPGDPERSAILLGVVRNDPAPSVQEAALHALARTGGSPQALIQLYGQLEAARHREALLFAIQRSGGAEARAFLRARVMDAAEPPSLREAALHSLSRDAPPGELIELYGRLEERRFREAVLFQVARSTDPAALAFLRERVLDPAEARPLREAALYQVMRTAEPAEVVRIYRRLDHPALKEAALYGLATRTPQGEAIPLLIEIARTDPTPRFREAAVHALTRSNDPLARQFLRELVTRP